MKKIVTTKLWAVLLLTGLFLAVYPKDAKAAGYLSAVQDLKQADATVNSITLEWSPSENATEYRVYYRESGSSADYVLCGSTNETRFVISNLKDGTEYYVQVKASDGTKESFGKTLYDAVTFPARVDSLHQKRWYYFIHSLDIGWDYKSGVSGYEISLCNSKGKVLQKKEVGAASSTSFNNVKDSVYTVEARAYTVFQNQKHYSATSSINCIPQARISKLKISGKKLSLSWKKVDGATGYKIYASTKKYKGYKLIKTLGKKSGKYTITKLKGKKINPKKTYYVYVETICKKGKKKGSSGALYYWSTKGGYGHLTG